MQLAIVLLGCIAAASGTRCSSSPTCPLYANDRLVKCSMEGINAFWGYKHGHRMNFPGKGLYTLARISKNEAQCCYDMHVQAFLCNAMRNGTEVDGAIMAKEVAIQASAMGVSVMKTVRGGDETLCPENHA